jgi:hypothetical protein
LPVEFPPFEEDDIATRREMPEFWRSVAEAVVASSGSPTIM